jgi:hypothetical protein
MYWICFHNDVEQRIDSAKYTLHAHGYNELEFGCMCESLAGNHW